MLERGAIQGTQNIVLLDRSFCHWINCEEREEVREKLYLL
jgi:hypothetical protein